MKNIYAFVLFFALVAVCQSTFAQRSDSTRIDELEKRLEQSLRQIEQLTREIRQLRDARPSDASTAIKPAASEPVSQTVARQGARIEELEQQVNQISAAGLRPRQSSGIPLHGFADVGGGYSRQNNQFAQGPRGFSVGSLGLYLTPSFGDRVKTLAELIFEVGADGELATDLERLQLGYTFSDALTAWGGRFHTPFGYWNTAFHHGQQIQTALTRPRFLDFEDRGGVLPVHTTGAWLTGGIPVNGGNFGGHFNYDFYLGNGPRINIDGAAPAPGGTLNPNSGSDNDHSALVGMRLEYALNSLEGAKLGFHGLRSRVRDNDATVNRTQLQFFGPYFVFDNDDWEILAEAYRFRNRDLTGANGTRASSAWYLQAGRQFGDWTPYARIEAARLDQTDNYFRMQNNGRSYHRGGFGLRYELNNTSALKIELARTLLRAARVGALDDRFGEIRAQFSVRF
ncbi:MAG: hypothetical protein ACKVQK_04800 [Burkholderiales bacterium]